MVVDSGRASKGADTMPLSAESVRRTIAEQSGRQVEPELAEHAAGLVSMLIDGLNSVDMAPMLLVEPTMAFEAGYREPQREEGDR
jgi:hypothetical protein